RGVAAMADKLEIVFLTGPNKGKRFEISSAALRIGRSSSSDVQIPDEELSRNHCMIEVSADGALTIADLASANGTFVNGENIEGDTKPLKAGDEVSIGTSVFVITSPTSPSLLPPLNNSIDLGFGGAKASDAASSGGDISDNVQKSSSAMRIVLLGVIAFLVVAIAIVLEFGDKLISVGASKKRSAKVVTEAPKDSLRKIISFQYEKVDADSKRIFRYFATLDQSGILSVEFDDLPGENRHMSRRKELTDAARAELEKIFAESEWAKLESHYSGADVKSENALKSRRIKLVGRDGVKEVVVENRLEPDGFPRIRERLEAWVNNELGVQSIQRSRAELESSSEHCEELGDAKWEERDVEMANLSEAIRFFKLAKNDLITLGSNTKDVQRIQSKIEKAEGELKRRYDDVRGEAERARQIGDWDRAKEEFSKIREMIPARDDDRHREAIANLEDIENRIQTLNKKGKRK
ncbi:MAG: FHA domain-containing protein, partial [Kiritimatiellae bacterium]|nr:FHA domain-containing protein [Kiritimatiellia bacterium]